MLSREVRIVFEGIDKHDILIGSRKCDQDDNQLADLSTDLLTASLAKVKPEGQLMADVSPQESCAWSKRPHKTYRAVHIHVGQTEGLTRG